jgi:hypothetical protein
MPAPDILAASAGGYVRPGNIWLIVIGLVVIAAIAATFAVVQR